MDAMRIIGGRVLLPQEERTADLLLVDSRIGAVDPDGAYGSTFDARGLLVLPGIVDIHGDAFERQLQPRPGVSFSPDIGLVDTETQLLANGITTAFHGVTLSWEPGLRSLDTWRALLSALNARPWACDMRIHLRWEAYSLHALDQALDDIAAGRVHLLAFNDHTPAILKKVRDPAEGAKYSDRAGMNLPDFRALAERIGACADGIGHARTRMAAAARSAGIPLASHDDATVEMRGDFRKLGAHICEFPMAEEVARSAQAAGDWVVMGSPNVVRGRSHLGWASAAHLAEAGICNVLSSDYFYPAMLRAALLLAGRGTLTLQQSWSLVSANPAHAAGLQDRGMIAVGKRADLVIVDPDRRQPIATIAAGRVGFLTSTGAERLRSVP